MTTPKFDLDAIPRLADDDPVIIAFSARRDLCAAPKRPAPTAPEASGNALEVTVTVAIKAVAAK